MPVLYRYSDRLIQFHHSVDPDPDDGNFPMHIHEQYEIFCFVSGSASYLVEGNEYPLEPGSVVAMRKTESHKIKILGGEPYERFAFQFYPELLAGVDPGFLLLEPFHDRPLGQNNHYRPFEFKGKQPMELLEAMCVTGVGEAERRLAIHVNMYPLLDLLRNSFKKKQAVPHAGKRSLAEELVAYINLHLFDDISLDSLSRHFFISVSQIGRVFRKATGSSVWDYIIIKRLSAAQSMIRDGMPLNKAAGECGFKDYSSFYRAYVKKIGTSPKADLPDKSVDG